MKAILKPAVLIPIIAGILIGGVLFTLGDYDDAPGLSAIGLTVGFVLIMIGVNKTGIIKKGWLLPIILFCLGAFITLLTTSILIEGEFEDKPWMSLIGFSVAAVLVLVGMLKVKAIEK
ncbi:MAG TPA: hypothetical protein PLD16_00155 [Fervidobacterium sp.]|jgi:hypothetical protein|nr:hypothetical protein [Fervidobacterium sp.]